MKGGGIEQRALDNRPPVKLLPTEQNLSRYTALFPSERMDNGHILQANPSYGHLIFMSDYPPYRDAVQLRNDLNLPASGKEYLTDNNSSSDNSDSFSSSQEEDNEDSDGS